MILLETANENDFSAALGILLACIGTYIVFLKFTLHPTKNRIENIQRSITAEIKKRNANLLKDARSAIGRIVPKDPKKREKEYLNRIYKICKADYSASAWVRSISGISIICLEFCVFLLFAVVVYRINPFPVIKDQILLSSQWILLAIPFLVWLVHYKNLNTKNKYTYSFMFMSSCFGLFIIGIGILMAYLHLGFSVLPEETANILIYIFFVIPLIPILIAFFSTTWVYWKKYRYCHLLEKTLKDYRSGELTKKLTQIKNKSKASH